MNVDLKGFNENVATFVADETVEAGMLVKLKSDYTVTACENDDEIIGYCLNVRDGYASVQISGYVQVNTTSSIGVGYFSFLASNSNTVKPGSSSRKYLIIHCTNGTLGFIL